MVRGLKVILCSLFAKLLVRLNLEATNHGGLTWAQSHGCGSAAEGSRSHGPKASMIHLGVKWTCEVPMVFCWLPKVIGLRLHSPRQASRCQIAGHRPKRGNLLKWVLWPTLIAAGVTDTEGKAKYKGLHALRHFYASWCINRKVDGGLELPAKSRPGAAWSFLDRNDDGHLRAPVPERRRWARTGASGVASDRLTRHMRDMEVNSPMKTKGTSISTGCVFKRKTRPSPQS